MPSACLRVPLQLPLQRLRLGLRLRQPVSRAVCRASRRGRGAAALGCAGTPRGRRLCASPSPLSTNSTPAAAAPAGIRGNPTSISAFSGIRGNSTGSGFAASAASATSLPCNSLRRSSGFRSSVRVPRVDRGLRRSRVSFCRAAQATSGSPGYMGVWEEKELFEALQNEVLFGDLKTIVDMPMKLPLAAIKLSFEALCWIENHTISTDKLRQFVFDHFHEAGDDLLEHVPEDFCHEPIDFLPNLEDPSVRQWALELHSLWKILSRKNSLLSHIDDSNHSSLMHLPHPFIIPGSRFREVYYWDSFWVIKGLIESKMINSAKHMVYNFLFLGMKFGFIPNGARNYYVNRSQPPLLSDMVAAVYDATLDEQILLHALPVLLDEYSFWNREPRLVKIRDEEGNIHNVNRFYVTSNGPRPESYAKDKRAAMEFEDHIYNKAILRENLKNENIYTEICTIAESGWDFSSRWMEDFPASNLLIATSILPVDLNAYLHKMEVNIARFARILGETKVEETFLEHSAARKRAFEAIFWNEEMGQWLDLQIPGKKDSPDSIAFDIQDCHRRKRSYASNFVPLWCELLPPGDPRNSVVVEALTASGLIFPAGVVTSLYESGEQWDYPNGWAPLQHMIVEGLEKTELPEAQSMARDLAQRWLNNMEYTYKATGYMHEKYDVLQVGGVGAGGEYDPQVGFGWTNGVALNFLSKYGLDNTRFHGFQAPTTNLHSLHTHIMADESILQNA